MKKIREEFPKALAIIVIIIGILVSFILVKVSGIEFDQIINILCHRILVYNVYGGILHATAINILLIPIAIILGIAFIRLVPEFKVLSYIGKDTLPIYLCHPYAQEVIRVFQTKKILIENDYINYGISLIFATIVLVILSSKFFRSLFYRILDKIKKGIFNKKQYFESI